MGTTAARLAAQTAARTRTYELVGKWRKTTFGARYVKVRIPPARPPLAYREYSLSIEPGRRVRIPYKPAGTYGNEWHGRITDEQGRTLWSGRCDKSTGAGGLLSMIGLR